MNKAQAIMHLYPNANPLTDFIVQDDSDDKGQYIAAWNVKDANGDTVTQPTDAALQTAWDSMQPTAADLLAAAQSAKKDELSAAVRAKITAGYQSTVVLASTGTACLYGTDVIDQQNMTASRVWSDNNPTATVKYRPSGGLGRIDHTRAEFVAVSDAIFDRVNWYLDQVDVYTPQIYAANATADSVNAIVITIADPA